VKATFIKNAEIQKN